MTYKDKKKQKQYTKEYWQQNKHKYRKRWIDQLGTGQDRQITHFLNKKKHKQPTPRYKPKSINAYKYNNQAQQSYPEEAIKQTEQFNHNYDGEKTGYTWIDGVGYVTEDPKVFFKKKKEDV